MYICQNPEIDEGERLAMREELEAMYCDTLDVFETAEVTDPKTHITSFERVATLTEVPCRVSEQTTPAATSGESARAAKEIKVILAPEVDIPAGSEVVVSYHGLVERYRQSGRAYHKSDTQTITLVLLEEHA